MSSLSYMQLFSRLTMKILQFHNILDKCQILGDIFCRSTNYPTLVFSGDLWDFLLKSCEISLLTEMSRNDADIKRF